MPWLTPDSIPEGGDCRPLSIPADSVWLALVSGALTELTLPYNWEKFGALTVQETIDQMQLMIDNYYDAACCICTTPGDYRVTRISPEGHLEELGSDGTWQPASGDYAIPAPTARTDGTEPDQNCLAAKNATNVMFTLYESLSDSWQSSLSADEAITALITSAVAAIGFEFAPITWSIAATGFVIFEALFAALQYVTADLWTDTFSQEFTCLLLGCVNNDAGVVTFDWNCFNNALLAQVNNMGLSEVQMRLYVQIGYLLLFIGGVDGLNLAARTTSITNDDCSFCPENHCQEILLADGDGSSQGLVIQGGTYITTCCWQGTANGEGGKDLYGYWAFPSVIHVMSATLEYYKGGGAGGDNVNHVNSLYPTATGYSTVQIAQDGSNATDPAAHLFKTISPDLDLAGVGFDINTGSYDTEVQLYTLIVRYTGSEVFGGDNCT
jgi:hypothetical protein